MDVAFVESSLNGSADGVCYLAGPPGFVKAMRSALDRLGFDPDNIRTEEFSGY